MTETCDMHCTLSSDPLSLYATMPSGLEKSRLAVADEVKFDMLTAMPELSNHAKQYKAISRNFACEYSDLPTTTTYLKSEA